LVFRSSLLLPNLFLLILVGLTLFYSFLSLESRSAEVYNIDYSSLEVRIVNRRYLGFGQTRYTAWSDLGTIHLVNLEESLQVGRQYKVSGQFQNYSLNSKPADTGFNPDRYYLSNKVEGKLDQIQVLATNTTCNLLCQLLGLTTRLKTWVETTYDHYHCKVYSELSTIIASTECQNSKAWSVGLIIGGSEFFTDDFKDKIRLAGLTHLIAVSGFQVSILASALEAILLKLRLSRNSRLFITFLSFALMIALVGPEPPVLRSIASVSLSLLVLSFLGRKIGGFRALVYSALILLIINPLYLVSYSFWLSFSTSFGLVLGMGEDIFQSSWLKSVVSVILSSLLSFIFSLPIILNFQPTVSVVSLLTNSIIVPIIPFLSLLNLLSLIPILGYLPALLAGIIQSLINLLTSFLADLVPLVLMSNFKPLDIFIYYLLMSLIIIILKTLTKSKKLA
jgi:ComEC/Rec2-related protein